MSAKTEEPPLDKLESAVCFLNQRINLLQHVLHGIEHGADQMEPCVSGPLNEVLYLLKNSGEELDKIFSALWEESKGKKQVTQN